jgi:tRNA threonylcarbamoyladenosine biosynthesis protein TsaE
LTRAAVEFTLTSASPEETLLIGREVGASMVGGLVIGLVGELGAGKTQLVKGIAAGNALKDVPVVTSPTFSLVHEYPGRLHLYHADVYRLRGPADLTALGFDEWVRPDAAIVVEWADRVAAVMPDDVVWIEMRATGEHSRDMTLRATGEHAVAWVDELRRCR